VPMSDWQALWTTGGHRWASGGCLWTAGELYECL